MTSPAVVGLDAAGSPEAWRAAGFAVDDGIVRIGRVGVRIGAEGRGITAWTLTGVPTMTTSVDGLPTCVVGPVPAAEDVAHPNRATLVDHLVVWSPHSDRTVHALTAIGFDVKRVREDARPGLRQTFFRAGQVVVELVASADPSASEDTPARFFGIACTVADLDACARELGDVLGPISDAVQPGRRIATLRGRGLGLDVAVAFMSEQEQ